MKVTSMIEVSHSFTINYFTCTTKAFVALFSLHIILLSFLVFLWPANQLHIFINLVANDQKQ